MPRISFDQLPDSARLWAFATLRELSPAESESLLSAVDAFLEQWAAHGHPLTCARDWQLGRFLSVAVDQRDAHASGCSIDGLYRVLRTLESQLGVGMLGGGMVYYRAADGRVVTATRDEFAAAGESGDVTRETVVFDLTVATAGDWRARLEKEAQQSWHEQLLPAAAQRN